MIDGHDRVQQELAAYALDALDPAEGERVAAHLRECDACRQELADYQAVVGLLPHQVERQTPAVSTKAALLRAARADAAPPAARGAPARLPLARRWASWAAVAAVIVGLLGWNIQLQRQVAGVGPGMPVEQIARLPDGRIVALLGSGAPGATARLFVEPDGRNGQLIIAGLPPLPPARSYQLWFARPGQPTATGGVFQVNDRGEAVVRVAIPAPLGEVRAIAVTEEPFNGSPQPTGVHLLDGQPV